MMIEMSAVELARGIAERRFGSREVVDAHIERIEAVNPSLNALVEPEPVQAVAAPAVAAPAEPTVVNQWTDENGHTWRVMSDGTNRWWNGTDWQKV